MTDHLKSRARRYAVVIVRSLITAAFVFVLATSAGIYVTNHVLTKVYSATAVMEVQPQSANANEETGWAYASESIESPEVLQAVVTDLGLDRVWAERLSNKSDALSSEEAVRQLKSCLRIDFKHGTNMVEVRASSDDAGEAANMANAVVRSYANVRDRQADASTRAVQILALATVPEEPSRPNKRLCYAITAGAAGLLSVLVVSVVEVCLLIARAEEAASELQPVH